MFGGTVLVIGTLAVFDAYATMLQITETGAVGQALAQSQYDSATQQFVIGGAGVAFGLTMVIIAAAIIIEHRLKELLEQAS
ncbi:hypothetical protein [Halorhabdus rudnickae]|uniref:hypothetical protein n=1 Tax=Halorhabdus rudnickae TaxID=1775544 RepID=UPI001083F65C|nr:hypothetical protein [Halorhabdus rudnickae]